jgi:hypothetical protein
MCAVKAYSQFYQGSQKPEKAQFQIHHAKHNCNKSTSYITRYTYYIKNRETGLKAKHQVPKKSNGQIAQVSAL